MSSIEYLITKNKPNFENWGRQLNEHLLQQYEPEADGERIFFQTNEMLNDIAQNFFNYGKFKDQFDTSKCSLFPFGQYILLRSEKMNIAINWGVEWEDFYLEGYLMHAENMRFMTDDFWRTLLDLKELGEFSFSGGGGLNSEQKPYFENKASAVFQLIRTFMINQRELMQSGDYGMQWEYGSLVLKWNMDNNWPYCLNEAVKHLNYFIP